MSDEAAAYAPGVQEAHDNMHMWSTDEIVNRLIELVLWEAKRYNGNSPIFATRLGDGRPLEEGIRREQTWRAIFGEPRQEAPPGTWVQCLHCRTWTVQHPRSDRSINDDDAEYIATAILRSRP